MKKQKFLLLIILINISFNTIVFGKNYAILMNGVSNYDIVKEYTDDKDFARQWYDLVLAYEYLIEEAGYTHEDILVFFNNGNNFESTINNQRYNISEQHPSWPNIVDFPQNESSVKDAVSDFSENTLTENDNLLIWIVSGHGTGSKTDPYADNFTYQSLGHSGWNLNENDNEIYELFEFVNNGGLKKYKRCKILWSSCFSGHLLVGNKTLLNDGFNTNPDNDKIITFSSTVYNKTGIVTYTYGPIQNEPHSGFTYAIYGSLMGEDPYGNQISVDDPNNDGVINMTELYTSITENSVFEFISWDNNKTPQRGDPCPKSDYTYMEEVLKLKNHTLSLVVGETIRYYRVDQVLAGDNLIIPNNSNIEFVIDTKVKLNSKFHACSGSRFHAYFGEVDCSS